ncbi:phosphatidate cytidylyltransferase [Paenarthrobacter sp. Z7-10]|uniref:phosphatidate cytidylyltransferase n=1 Tax=Paenarthrobacter sp. Z7-10 TaxID=2787635 RepID=UPI0022A9D35E|nr:phosphatidate cytidylyltransferase [Paenarthrobacter sp. Z7-10]MCZ2402505.1 phosphatidate cytidylyltransferase [Paenarthrobacter sp. Z7-10]
MSDSQPPPAGPVPTGPDRQEAAAPGSAPQPPIEEPAVVAEKVSKAGRNLPAAIVVGLAMLVIVLVGLLIYPIAFVLIVTVFAVIGVAEVSRALLQRGIGVPLAPVMIGTIAMPASAYFAGGEGLLFALVASSAAVLVWRSLDSAAGAIQSIFAGLFALTWIPFLISFVFLQLRGTEGPTTGITWDWTDINVGALQVAVMLLLVVSNDTAGYLVGALFGKHPMAPKISPKKSWEGFGGSLAGAVLVAVPATVFLLDQPWWLGLVLAVGMVASSTAGDLAESMVKRELGVKDMSSILPGHGGVMDRLDSILFAAPSAFIIFTVFQP